MIQDTDFYNFNETGFIIGVIYNNIVVINTNRENRYKILQPNNRE